MSELQRVSPLVAPAGGSPVQIATGIKTLEERPKIPEGTPTSTTDYYHGQFMTDGAYLYVAFSGVGWKRAALSAVP